MPEGWAWCRLGEIVEVSSAKRVLQQDWKKSGIPFYRAREIAQLSNNEKVIDDLFITSQLYSELKLKYGVPIAGDLMVSAVGTIGKIYIVKDTDCFYYKDASVICFSKKEKNIDSLYLKFCCETDFLQEQMYSQSKGTTVDTITINKAQNYLIPLPPISEQKKIVDSIQKFFSHIDILGHKKSELKISIKQAKSKILDLAIHGKLVPQDPNDEPAVELLKRIATSDNRPYEKVGEVGFEIPESWQWVKLSSICTKLVDGDHNPPKGIEEKTDYIMASSRNINFDRLDDLENVRYLTKEVFEIENTRTKAEKGDIFFTSVGTLGRSCIYFGGYNICFQRSVTILHTNINNQFLKYFFDSNFFQNYVIGHSTGTAQMGFYLQEMSNSPIAIPPLSEQKRIVSKIDELFSNLDQIQSNLI
uniref:restriction endonuclease subunit S n=1 Tax=Treponema pectinovorum TaxID=164 RepID=UPI0021C3C38D|nr:restriction endonuclease subunit S [Treponema pectinovorum]